MMAVRTGSLGKLSAAAAMVLGCWFASAMPAQSQEACSEAAIGHCFPNYSAITAVTWEQSGYVAIGTSANGLAVIYLSSSGDVVSTADIATPTWMESGPPRIEKILLEPDGDLLLVGWATFRPSDNLIQVGVLGVISPNGDVQWSEPVRLSDTTSTILRSAAYDAERKNYVVVGRHTNGADDGGKCKFWSQGLVILVPEGQVTTISKKQVTLIGDAKPGVRNRMALYDIVSTGAPGGFAATGFMTNRDASGKGCQDDAVAMTLTAGPKGWTISRPYAIATTGASEVAFAIAPTTDGRFALAGQGVDPDSEARAAVLAGFGFSDGDAVTTKYFPYPADGTDQTGGDRFRTLLPMTDGGFLAAGSGSSSRNGRNHGFWRRFSPSLEPVGDERFLTGQSGSDILAAAIGGDGGVLGVGTHGSGGTSIGWIGPLSGSQNVVARRQPDSTLPLLSAQQVDAGSVTIAEQAVTTGTGFRIAGSKAGATLGANLSFGSPTDFTATALADHGDVDLALVDAAGHTIAFSSNLGDAGEYLHQRLAVGRYHLISLAISEVEQYEVRLFTFNLEPAVTTAMATLDEAGRKELDRRLANAGYGMAADPSIAFGSATVRAFLAFYNTVTAGSQVADAITLLGQMEPTVVE
jgi:hypothetical protein